MILPHLKDRPATRLRYPDGVEGQTFFEKNAPAHTPRLGPHGLPADARREP